MNRAILALLFIVGLAVLALGLIVVTLPLLSNIPISFPELALGGACLVVGVISLWFLRNEVNRQPSSPPASNRSFFAVLGIVNLVLAALGVPEGEWHNFILWVAAGGIVVLVVKITAQRRAKK
jgi:hypothetical protein